MNNTNLESLVIDLSLGAIWAVLGLIAFIFVVARSYDKENKE